MSGGLYSGSSSMTFTFTAVGVGDAFTALHYTSCLALECDGAVGYFSFFVLRRRARLLAHPDVAARLWDGHLAAGMERLMPAPGEPPAPRGFDDYFELTPLSEAAPVRVGPFAIECRRTIHHIPTTALRVRAGGRSLGLSSDTAFDPSLIAWLAEADLVVHETNYGVHTPHEKLAELPAELRRKMRLTHCPDGFESDAIELLVQGRRTEITPS